MKRTKKIVLVSHCILNLNSKVEGLCEFGNTSYNVIKFLMDNDYGIIQLPCPELTIYGIKRWGHVKEQFDTPYYRKHCREIFEPILNQIEDYTNNGYEIKGFLAVNGSPSCGYDLTCSSNLWGGEFSSNNNINNTIETLQMIKKSGVFMEEIEKMLDEKNIKIDIISVHEENEKVTMKNLKAFL